MKRQRLTVGAIVEINVYDEYYCYAQILGLSNLAFFDYRTKEHLEDFSVLSNCNILFILICIIKKDLKSHLFINTNSITRLITFFIARN